MNLRRLITVNIVNNKTESESQILKPGDIGLVCGCGEITKKNEEQKNPTVIVMATMFTCPKCETTYAVTKFTGLVSEK